MIYIVAPEHRQAEYWLTHQDPPISPRSRDVLIICQRHSVQKLRGRQFHEGDRVILYNVGACRDLGEILDAMEYISKMSPFNPKSEYVS